VIKEDKNQRFACFPTTYIDLELRWTPADDVEAYLRTEFQPTPLKFEELWDTCQPASALQPHGPIVARLYRFDQISGASFMTKTVSVKSESMQGIDMGKVRAHGKSLGEGGSWARDVTGNGDT
jgi:hypothetical protein